MKLDEAIKHCEEVVENFYEKRTIKNGFKDEKDYEACMKCANEHRQLAEWLRELRHLKNIVEYARYFNCTIEQAENDLLVEKKG